MEWVEFCVITRLIKSNCSQHMSTQYCRIVTCWWWQSSSSVSVLNHYTGWSELFLGARISWSQLTSSCIIHPSMSIHVVVQEREREKLIFITRNYSSSWLIKHTIHQYSPTLICCNTRTLICSNNFENFVVSSINDLNLSSKKRNGHLRYI